MSRYIDADALLNNLPDDLPYKASVKRVLIQAPTADVVEVVRCKDCIYAKPYECADGKIGYYCQNNNSTFRYGTNWERLYQPAREADDYCSCGERREENDS